VPAFFKYRLMRHATTEKTAKIYQVTLEQARSQLNMEADFTDDDVILNRFIKGATAEAEAKINKDIALTSCVMTIKDSQGEKVYFYKGNQILIDEGHLNSLTAIKYLDEAQEEQILDSSKYDVTKYYNYFLIDFRDAVESTKITIEFKTGFTADETPPDIIDAILIKLTDSYDIERGTYGLVKKMVSSGAADAFERKLAFHVKTSF